MNGDELLPYREARELIYLPTFKWMLDNCVQNEVEQLRSLIETKTVVLLDYTTNGHIDNLKTPLSHAALVKRYIEDDWPV